MKSIEIRLKVGVDAAKAKAYQSLLSFEDWDRGPWELSSW